VISPLVSASIKNNDATRLEKLPKNLLGESDLEVVEFLLDYQDKHGQLPTVERFQQTKHGFYYQEILLTTPLDDLLEESIRSAKFNAIEMTFNTIREDHNAQRDIDVLPFLNLANKISAASPITSRSVGEFTMDELIPEMGDYIPFGLETFDKSSGGIGKGETALMFAPTGIGKTTYLCFLAVRAARAGYKVMLVSKEMSDVRILQRITAILGNFDPFWFINSARDASYISKLKGKSGFVKKQTKAYEALGGDIIIPKAKVYTPSDIRGRIINEVAKTDRNFDLILIDGLNHMHSNTSPSGTFASDDWRVMRSISQQLLELSQNDGFETRVIATSQCKAGTDTNKSSGWTYDDIGYSKSVVEDASVVGVLSKSDGAHIAASTKIHYRLAHMLKNRNGEDAGAVPPTQLKIDFNLMNMFSGSTNYINELSSVPLGAEMVVK